MGDVVPLKTAATTDSKAPRVRTRPQKLDISALDFDPTSVASSDEKFHINSEEGDTHRKNGIQIRLLQKLKKGQFKISDQLDLHNMTTETAHTTLINFIDESSGHSLACIRIIHGKGLRSENGPRLKLMTRQLLREHPLVMAFTACKPADGGDGATDVLLKSS
jgi:DNA-nicking Smr family endonuclease